MRVKDESVVGGGTEGRGIMQTVAVVRPHVLSAVVQVQRCGYRYQI